ncbi:MAG: tol-pal system protein YbgF [Deltaproteobacteria bacterium]|nr:tol-pal system protein YbgF [Deltaproteobacteria bacterium]
MQVRRDNASLRRKVQMLEDRVLYMEQRTGSPSAGPVGASATPAGAHTLPDGRELPVLRLEPDTPPPRRAAAGRRPAPQPAPGYEAEPEYASATSDDVGPGYRPASADEAAVTGPARSYRLVGTRLVDLTRQHAPAGPDRPSHSAKGKAIVGEYEAAMAMYKSGQPDRAETAFDAFAQTHPRHDYADNALYWKGEAAYDQRHYADALAAFTEVVERYGGGNKAPDALLKIGLCYRQLGDVPNARDVLSELIAAYPGERASDIARVKLAEFES